MLSLLPDFADPLRLCSLGKVYEGTIALAEFPRLAPLLASTEGEAAFALAFAQDEERRPGVRVQVRARLLIECQRCLGPMAFEVDSVSQLAVVSGPDEAQRLPAELDPLLVEDGQVVLRSLIEDELILAVPPAPAHAEAECAVRLGEVNAGPAVAAEPEAGGKPNPFAALAALKRDIEQSD
jgi:uncharacterized protein